MTRPYRLKRLTRLMLVGAVLCVTAGMHTAPRQERDSAAQFVTIVLGAAGGLYEDNLTAYLLAPKGDTHFVAWMPARC